MSNSVIIFFFIFAGIVLGSLVAHLTSGIKWLAWLSFALKFGLDNPIQINLHVLKLSLGFSLNLNICTIIFVTIAILIANTVTGKRRRK